MRTIIDMLHFMPTWSIVVGIGAVAVLAVVAVRDNRRW